MIDVMILEDDQLTGKAYAQLLEAKGLSIIVFTHGAIAIEWLRSSTPKAALLDKRLRECDGSLQRIQGWDVFRFIRTHWSTVPCVIVTQEPVGKEDFRFGVQNAVHYFDKTEATPEEIIDAVCNAISSAALRVKRDQIVMAAEATCYGILSSQAIKFIQKDIESLAFLSKVAEDEASSAVEGSFSSQADTLRHLTSIARRVNDSFEKLRNMSPRFTLLLDEVAAIMVEPVLTCGQSLISLSPRTVGSEIASLLEIARFGLNLPLDVVQVQDSDTIVMMDEFFGTQLIYLALRLSLERVQGNVRASVSVEVKSSDETIPSVTVVFKDNGGIIVDSNYATLAQEENWMSSPHAWLSAQFLAIRSLARRHGGDATFEAWTNSASESGLATRICLPTQGVNHI